MHALVPLGALQPSSSSCGLVAGARYEPLQIEMKPVGRFLAGLRSVAQVPEAGPMRQMGATARAHLRNRPTPCAPNAGRR
jgi:hypothetical protein